MKKMKYFKKFFTFVIGVLLLCLATNSYAIDDKVTFTKSKTFDNYSSVLLNDTNGTTYSYGTTYKKAKFANGTEVYAYCFNHKLDAPPVNSILTKRNLTASENKKLNAFTYILEHGLGGNWSLDSSFTEEEKYYITQLAIWLVQGNDGGITNLPQQTGRKETIRQATYKLYNAAMKYTPAKGSLAISPATSVMKLTGSGDSAYYRTDDYTVSGSGFGKYTVNISNAPAGTKIVVSSNNKEYNLPSATLDAGTKFYLKVPVSKASKSVNPTITVNAKAQTKQLVIYEHSSPNYQNVGVPYTTPNSMTKKATATLSPTGSLIVSKKSKDASGQIADLKNVVISVKNSSGTVVAKWNTNTENPKKIDNLPVGVYTIVEESAPAGYTKSSNINVTIKGSKTETVELINVKDRKNVTISKQDATTGSELPGAHIQLVDVQGKLIEEWDSTNVPHIVEAKLDPKFPKYCLIETIAPKGYQKKTTKQCFEINKDGGVDTPVVMVNEPETSIKISKQDVTTGKELPGAKLIIKNKETGEKVDEWISTTKPHYVNLLPGKYTLVEITSPEGYGLSEEVIDFEVTNNGVEQTIVMNNSPIPETADIPVILVGAGLLATVLIAGFSMFKISKQQA